MFDTEKIILPTFPRTLHLPYGEPNATKDDVVAQESEAAVVFEQEVHVEEKIDGASVGMTILDGHPLIRNRDHILRKGYVKNTPAKKQFASVWNWWYQHRDRFEKLEGFSVYGEWMKARHGIYYNILPDWFIAYDVYDHKTRSFLAANKARRMLLSAGFVIPTASLVGYVEEYGEFEELTRLPSTWSEELSEGVYVKVSSEEEVTHRFKMVRQDFVRGKFWDGKTMMKNKLA